MTDTAQLLVFVCGVDSSFQVTEELAGLMSLHGQTTGLKIFNSVKSVIDDLGLSWGHISCGWLQKWVPGILGNTCVGLHVIKPFSVITVPSTKSLLVQRLLHPHRVIHC